MHMKGREVEEIHVNHSLSGETGSTLDMGPLTAHDIVSTTSARRLTTLRSAPNKDIVANPCLI